MTSRSMYDKINHKYKSGDKHHNWKGDNVGIEGLHRYVDRHLPKQDLCEMCKKVPPKELANITGIYNREFKNWARFCHKCHKLFDNIETRNLNRNGSKPIDMSERICLLCSKTSSYRRHWYMYENGHICVVCYNKINRN